jgi:hypothetical protein
MGSERKKTEIQGRVCGRENRGIKDQMMKARCKMPFQSITSQVLRNKSTFLTKIITDDIKFERENIEPIMNIFLWLTLKKLEYCQRF